MNHTLFDRLVGPSRLLIAGAGILMVVLAVNHIKAFRYIGKDTSFANTISVSGEGEAIGIPDIATFSFGASATDLAVNKAQEKVTTTIDKALDFLSAQGIEDRDIKTTNYSIYPRYEYTQSLCVQGNCPPSGRRTLAGYEVTQTIGVKVRDTQKVGALLGGLGELGVSNVSGVSFSIDDEDVLIREARKEAIQDAREKAEALARDLGVRLGSVVSFSEGGGIPYYAKAESFDSAMGNASPAAPSVPAGESTITSYVNITYEIR